MTKYISIINSTSLHSRSLVSLSMSTVVFVRISIGLHNLPSLFSLLQSLHISMSTLVYVVSPLVSTVSLVSFSLSMTPCPL